MLPVPVSQSVPGRGHTQKVSRVQTRTSPADETRSLIPGKYYHLIFAGPVQQRQERLILCLSANSDEYESHVLAIRYKIEDSWSWGIATSDFIANISGRVLIQLPSIKEIYPTDFLLYVGWSYVSPQLAELIKNCLL